MSEFTCISPERALELRSQGAQIVDIRDPHSYASLHVAGAQRLDNQNIHDFIAAADLDAPLLVFCYHGHSSQSAAAYLAHQGFSDVYSLDGGFEGWRNQFPQDIERGQQ